MSAPAASDVAARSGDGSIDVERITGRLELKSGDGSIHGRDLGGAVTAHPLGSCRVGDDPATSALDDRHELRGHPGLFVTDAAAVPTSLTVNPSLTIAALAERASPGIIARARETGVPVTYTRERPG